MKNTIVGIGEILWDVFPERKVLGGAPANFAYHVSQFGLESCVVSALGKDALGREIEESLDEKKLNRILEQTDYPTGTVQVTLDKAGVPSYEICEQVAWDYIPLTPSVEALARSARAVCFGSLAQRNSASRETINRFLELMPTDAYKIFDINLRQHYYTRELILDSLNKCNILKINDDEVLAVSRLFGWDEKSEMEVCQSLLENFKLDLLILTKGAVESIVLTRDETSVVPTPRVEVADTVGAGDSFTAAFVAALLLGKTVSDAHRLAVETSAYICTQHGAMARLPDTLVDLFKK